MNPVPALPDAGAAARAALVDDLRRRIACGEYRVPVEVVADAVLRAWRQPCPEGEPRVPGAPPPA